MQCVFLCLQRTPSANISWLHRSASLCLLRTKQDCLCETWFLLCAWLVVEMVGKSRRSNRESLVSASTTERALCTYPQVSPRLLWDCGKIRPCQSETDVLWERICVCLASFWSVLFSSILCAHQCCGPRVRLLWVSSLGSSFLPTSSSVVVGGVQEAKTISSLQKPSLFPRFFGSSSLLAFFGVSFAGPRTVPSTQQMVSRSVPKTWMNKLSQPPIEASWRRDNFNWMKWGFVRQALLLPVNQVVNSYFNYSPINKSQSAMQYPGSQQI